MGEQNPRGFNRFVRDYFGGGSGTSIVAVRAHLWTDTVSPSSYASPNDKYQQAVLEQYLMFVEMADRVSARRGLTNTFFLTLNTAILTAVGAVFEDGMPAVRWVFVFPVAALTIQCAAWFWLVRSYRQLNSAKFVVIGALEESLPASPYWRAEWKALGEGKDRSKYWPLTHLEQWTPILFATVYILGLLLILLL
jgi:hypothetical protein